jgi:putative membrane protein
MKAWDGHRSGEFEMNERKIEIPVEPNPQVYLAVERTLLAWIRTGLALMGFGFVVARFGLFLRTLEEHQDALPPERGGPSVWFGTVLILFGVAVQLLAGWQYVATVGRLRRGEALRIVRSSTGVLLVALLALLGLAMSAYLFVVS